MDLPDRVEISRQLDHMIDQWRATSAPPTNPSVAGREKFRPEPTPPAVYAIGLNDVDELSELDRLGVDEALAEITRRLNRLVRSDDVLGHISAGLFLLAASSVAPSTARQIMDRVTGAVAMPLDVGGRPISMSAAIGIAFAFDEVDSEELIEAALADLERIQSH